MKILFVVPNVPSPVRPRPFNIIRHLSREHDVTVLCLATNYVDCQFAGDLKRICSTAEVFEVSQLRSLWNCFAALFSSRPLRYAFFHSPQLVNAVRQKLASESFDVLHVEHLKAALILRDVTWNTASVLDAVDCVSLFETRRKHLEANPLLKLFSSIEAKKMAHWEHEMTARYDRVALSSAIDQQHYPAPPDSRTRLRVVANSVDLDYFQFHQYQTRNDVVVFSAKLDYSANADAALYFANEVWPLLHAAHPELRFEIVGSRPSRRIRNLDGRNNIRVTGSVPDVRPHLGSAAVAVCPVRLQAGTQNKIFEAMALGVPVVASSICCDSLPAIRHGTHLLAASTPSEFVSAIESILANADLRTRLVEEGRSYVERHHDWSVTVRDLLTVYAQVISERAITPVHSDTAVALNSGAIYS